MKQLPEKLKKQMPQLASHKQIMKFKIREKEFEKTTTQKIKRFLVNKEE